ncbi:hypothetical protein Aple_009930 [Acrocarpospora pleiomorpha]|uniref:Anchored repeat ABC transporter, substrate-binding protein n=1 Tax=Acrocarpospora pleiomorpha TaxID=90975 RepID=A0A5M3XJ49_9ACTN|nr:hypothetical protein Aple_009930 [Acrocarpospora pleiomorpha]
MATAAILAAVMLISGCTDSADADKGDGIKVVTTIGIIADMTRQIGGDRVDVTTIVPENGDVHSYEPSPGDAKKVVDADLALTNGLLLEEQSIIKMIDSNLPEGARKVAVAELASKHGGLVMPLTEDLGLDVLWLGLAVTGKRFEGEIQLAATALKGPGDLFVYLADTFGEPTMYFDSSDGFDTKDTVTLPPGAHTHVNWAFTERGDYTLTLAATRVNKDGSIAPLGEADYTFAVGKKPGPGRAFDLGHTDLAVDTDNPDLYIKRDDEPHVAAEGSVLVAPDLAWTHIPDDPRYTFLGPKGGKIWQLPQAVLGKHVHGEEDPHLWENPINGLAYARVVAEELTRSDPDGAAVYAKNAERYLTALDDLRQYVTAKLATIPAPNRNLITTHDAFGYLAQAHNMKIAGFVVPNPGMEPSAAQITKLSETIRDLKVPAVFVEPNLARRASVLRQVAADLSVQVCMLYGDTFNPDDPGYIPMMRHNADELARCLT